MEHTRCYGVYERTREGVWLYPWGQPVTDARDIRVRDVLRLGVAHGRSRIDRQALVEALRDDPLVCLPAVADADVDLTSQHALDLVVGTGAPELHVRAMMTTTDIATLIASLRTPSRHTATGATSPTPRPSSAVHRCGRAPSSGTGTRRVPAPDGAPTSTATVPNTTNRPSTRAEHAGSAYTTSAGRQTEGTDGTGVCGDDVTDIPPASGTGLSLT